MKKLSVIFASISTRLILLFVAMAVLYLVFVGSAISYAFKTNFNEYIMPHMLQYLEYTQADIGTPPDIEKAKAISEKFPIDIYINSATTSWSSTGEPLNTDDIGFHQYTQANGFDYLIGETFGRVYLLMQQPDYQLTFAFDHTHKRWQWHRFMPLTVLLVILFISYFAIRHLFGPLKTIQSGIQKIGNGELDHRIDVQRKDELGKLAGSINSMAGEIRQMLDAKRQLLLAISHELRSPLTRAKVATELLENQNQKESIKYDLEVMQTLIDEILETERLNNQHSPLQKQHIDIDELIKQIINEHYQGKVSYKSPSTIHSINIDETRIKLLLKNLIDNAIKHSPATGQLPKISIEPQNETLTISITDHGSGIDPEHLPHLTEPFYRVDTARQHDTGGYGLGLYLCRLVAEAHGGYLTINSEKGIGTTVTVDLSVNRDHVAG